MMAAIINRKQLKIETKAMLADAQVSPKAMLALYLGIALVLNLLENFTGDTGILATFVSILTSLLLLVLDAGFVLYCMAIRRGERAEYLTLFDGFSFVGKIIALHIIMYIFIALWTMLFVFPGIVASYRYRFALYNLYENPGMGVLEALDMSKKQTVGYKLQLFTLDMSYMGWSLLAAIPAMSYSAESYQVLLETMPAFTPYTLAAAPAEFSLMATLPTWGWLVITSLWSLAVGLFYIPAYQCVELGYFEIAKSTSGVGVQPQQEHTAGPDSMGGF